MKSITSKHIKVNKNEHIFEKGLKILCCDTIIVYSYFSTCGDQGGVQLDKEEYIKRIIYLLEKCNSLEVLNKIYTVVRTFIE